MSEYEILYYLYIIPLNNNTVAYKIYTVFQLLSSSAPFSLSIQLHREFRQQISNKIQCSKYGNGALVFLLPHSHTNSYVLILPLIIKVKWDRFNLFKFYLSYDIEWFWMNDF